MRSGAILIAIKIGEVTPLRFEGWDITPDDRQSQIETIGGVEVQDFGHVEEGDKISCAVTLSGSDAATIYSYWHNRTLVTVTGESGITYNNSRVVVKAYSEIKHFPTYFAIKLEFWRK